jgi:hypothetical protein
MNWLKSWLVSRRGITAVVLAVVLGSVFAAATGRSFGAVILPFLLVGVLATWFLAKLWTGAVWPSTPTFARRRALTGAPQLREDNNARFLSRRGFLFERIWFFVATGMPPLRVDPELVAEATTRSDREPLLIARDDSRQWWIYQGAFYWESYGYSPHDIAALIHQRMRRRQQQLDHARMLYNAEQAPPANRRGAITKAMRQAVYERDGGACVECDSTFDLQYDHLIPVALGGATTVDNLQLLCSACNQSKGGRI